jgi:hypothetical protein
MQFSPLSRHFIPLQPKYFLQHRSQMPSVYAPPVMSHVMEHKQNYSLVYSNSYVFWQQMRRQQVLPYLTLLYIYNVCIILKLCSCLASSIGRC